MALTLQRLRQHMASNSVPHKRVYFFHAHVYCHQDQLAAARDFQARVSDVWQGDERISVHQLKDTAVGPHPLPNFELLFCRDVYTDFITWLQFERPDELSIMIHTLTDQLVPDHTSRAMWLGQQPPGPYGGVRTEPLVKQQHKSAAEGWSEEDYAERLKNTQA